MTGTVEKARGAGVAWALVALAATSGYVWIVEPANRQAAQAREQLLALQRAGDRDENLLRRAAALPATASARELPAAVLVRRSAAQTTIVALRSLARETARRHVTLAAFGPAGDAKRSQAGQQEIGLSLRGRYADVLQTVAGLSQGPVLLEIRGLTMTQTFDATGSGGVDAAIDGVLFSSPNDVSDAGKEDSPMIATSALQIARDPFSAARMQPDRTPAAPVGGLIALPPNAGAGVPVLRAVIDGDPPRALVEIGDRPAILRVGSRIGFATVTAISADGVRLDDGRTLRIEGTRP